MSLPAQATGVTAAAAAVALVLLIPAQAQSAPKTDAGQPVETVNAIALSVVNDIPVAKVKQIVRSDHFQVDQEGRIRSVEKKNAPAAAPSSALAVPPGVDVFKLHSRQGSNRTIYLDFTGHSVEGTAWNGGARIDAPPYDSDGNPSSYNDAEREAIYQAFLAVSEDYRSFDVDVTTEETIEDKITRSGSADQVYGTRAVITPKDVTNCGCGGQAYIGTFDEANRHANYQPAWAYATSGYDGKSIAEIVSHETGHNLGLGHDGQTTGTEYYGGHTNWAPIMGVGYGQPVTQWSKGEYTNANNTEDDLSVIPANGAPTLADDFPNDPASAASLTDNTPVTGIISTDADVDVFAIQHAGGTLTAKALPAVFAPDLDIKLTVRDASGTVVATVDPPVRRVNTNEASGLDASFSQSLGAGRYTFQVEGTGAGNPATNGYSGYATLGQFTLTVDAG
ncbi:zinc-dependent metalloprotease family protein [Kibdelosporangium aridum]|uniref:zinc-dependent metalloprotease family protein n=1 Tax=Kibdelosporangium aridum TaxID=2030 RepID=UPI0007C50C95|nr:zinc-dependent metalloprotease family protein [Kibdelosporangium aridum]